MNIESDLAVGYWVLLFVLGACIFSFLNVVIYRSPRHMSFLKGRSICPACGHTLGVPDLVPVVSYVFLRGKCRYCKAKIGPRDTFVELLGGAFALLCAWYWRQSPAMALLIFAFFCILTVVTFVDLDTMEIPNGCALAILALAAVCILCSLAARLPIVQEWAKEGFLAGFFGKGAFSSGTFPNVSFVSRLIGMVCISLPMLLIALALPGAFGGGDIKLMGACGLFLGLRLTLVSTVLAFLTGGLWGALLLVTKKKGRKDQFAFGPFLCAGMVLGLLFGERLIGWYLGLF